MRRTTEFNPATELLDVGAALSYLSNAQDAKDEYGLSKLLHDLGKEVDRIASRIMDEEWEAPTPEELEARRQEKLRNVPGYAMSSKNDGEIITMLQDLFEENKDGATSIKEMIGVAHYYLKERQKAQ